MIKLICGGYSNKKMANQMCLSPRTIEWHRNEILQKLDVKNTAEIVVYAKIYTANRLWRKEYSLISCQKLRADNFLENFTIYLIAV